MQRRGCRREDAHPRAGRGCGDGGERGEHCGDTNREARVLARWQNRTITAAVVGQGKGANHFIPRMEGMTRTDDGGMRSVVGGG
jgi:hypothetical protein